MPRLLLRRLERIIDDFARLRLLVTGDLVLDEYIWGDVERVSPEAPVPVVLVRDESLVPGGAANAVRNVVALGGAVECCAVVGDDVSGRRIAEMLKDIGVDPQGLVEVAGRPTTRKTRIVANRQQLARFDRESFEAPPREARRRLLAAVDRCLGDCHGAIVADYGKGVLTPSMAAAMMRRCREAGVPVAVDPKLQLVGFDGAALIKPNLREAEALLGLRIRDREDLLRAGAQLRRRARAEAVVVTRGGGGMTLFEGNAEPLDVPAVAQEVFDVQGAGDTAIAALALARWAGATLYEAAVIANAAAGVVVGKVGTATASAAEVKAALPVAVEAARSAS